jgi:serine/threonine-protein kinase RsbW
MPETGVAARNQRAYGSEMVQRPFPRELSALEQIRKFVREEFRHWNLPEDAAWDVDLVIEELFTNILKYGPTSAEPVMVTLEWLAPLLTIQLRDTDSAFFDPTVAPSPDTDRPITERTAGGLGLHFIRKLAERFAYSYEGRVSLTTVTLRLEK